MPTKTPSPATLAQACSSGQGALPRRRDIDVQGEIELRRRALAEGNAAGGAARPAAGPAIRSLVAYLRPVVQAQVARVLLVHGRRAERARIRASVEDAVQDVMQHLFAHDWRHLRAWDPTKGRSLRSWVGLLADRRTRDALRVREVTVLQVAGVPEGVVGGQDSEAQVITAQLWQTVRGRVLAELTPDGCAMFALLFDQDLSTQEIMAQSGKGEGAIFKRRHELRRRIRAHLQAALSEGKG